MDAGLDLLVIGKDLRHSIDKKNLVVSLRTSKFGPNSIGLEELEQFCIDHSSVPQNEDEGFYDISPNGLRGSPFFSIFYINQNYNQGITECLPCPC
jgi:hypothetical protein